jgi:ABC-2 type transport system ATP-binding protein
MSLSARLITQNLCYAYGARRALDQVSIRVEAGEVYALLGPNGAGKSTLMRALCGRIKPSQGSIRLSGLDPYHSRQARQTIGLVPQDIERQREFSRFCRAGGFARQGGAFGGG